MGQWSWCFTPKSNTRDTFTNLNPSFQIAAYLTGTKLRWGILTNGRHWRLYSTRSHLPLGNYYQVDLVQLLQAPEASLKYFYLFFRRQALVQVDGRTFLDRLFEGSEEYAVELEADIKARAYEVVELLCRGFAADLQGKLTDEALREVYNNSLTLLYRLLFVFYAEARELLPLSSSQSYRDNYSMHKVTGEIAGLIQKGAQLSDHSKKYYQFINDSFRLINSGDPGLRVPEYNGGLFDPRDHPFLEQHGVADAYLVPAIHQLARVTDKKLKREVAVDYNTLSERHLGSIYEGLLEFQPQIAATDLVVVKEKSGTKYAPAAENTGKNVAYRKGEIYLANGKGERKASGSYYTPEYIVNYIVETTLDPLAKEAQEKVQKLRPDVEKAIAGWEQLKEQKHGAEPTEKYDHAVAKERERLLQPYLSLKVLDPAMGSGHFLSRATDFLAEAIATDPCVISPVELSDESELTHYRRRVVESCIYGVDLNPLAVELAKLTLWLTTMAKSKPLSFLNHHLRVGNSLIGSHVSDLDEIPKVKKKKNKGIDLSRAPVQLGLFQEALNRKLYDLLQNRALIAQLPTETLEDVHKKQEWEAAFQGNMKRFRTLADVWVNVHFGNQVAWDIYNNLVDNLQSAEPDWAKLLEKRGVQKALDLRENYRFFHWELEFPEVFFDEQGNRRDDAGFDAVIGNPPYVNAIELDRTLSPYEKPFWKTRFTSASGAFDLYLLFFELGISITAIGKRVALITPNKYLSAPYALAFRSLIASRHELISLRDYSRVKVFDDPSVYPIVTVLRRIGGIPKDYIVSATIAGNIKRTEAMSITHPSARLRSLPDFLWGFLLSSNFALIEKLVAQSDALSEVATVQATSTTAEADEFASLLKDVPVGDDKKFINTGLIDRFASLWGIDRLMHMGRYYSMPFLSTASPIISASRRDLYDLPKIVLSKIALYPEAFADFAGEYASANTNCVHSAKYDLGYLCSTLNSSLMELVYSEYFGALRMSGGYYQFQAPQLSVLPIRRINFTTPDQERNELLEQVRKLYGDYLQVRVSVKSATFSDQSGQVLGAIRPLTGVGQCRAWLKLNSSYHHLQVFLLSHFSGFRWGWGQG